MSIYAERLAKKRASHGRLYLHVALVTALAAALIGLSVWGFVSLRTMENMTLAEAVKNAQTQTLARNFKKLTLGQKIFFTAQSSNVWLMIAGVVCAAAAAFLWRVALKKDQTRKHEVSGYLEAFDFLLPFLVGLALFTIYPIINVVLLSFKEKFNVTFQTFSQWGTANYVRVLNDANFGAALKNTGEYVLFVVPISTCIAILIANLLNHKLKCSALFQTAYFLPMVTAATATGLAWKFMFNADYGLIDYMLSWFGVEPIKWLTQAKYNIWALIIYGVWNILPFTIILMLSGLQNIDDTYYMAARVDGAKSGRIFFRITVPLLAPTISLVLIINSISSAKVFNDLFPLFNGNPGVFNNLYTVVYYIYKYAFASGGSTDMGRAAAASIVLFFILFALTMIQLFIQRKWQYH